MFVVNAHLTIDPDRRDEFLVIMDAFVASTRQEEGNRAFELTAHLSDLGAFTLFEHWESEAALGVHVSQPYFRALVDISEYGTAGPFRILRGLSTMVWTEPHTEGAGRVDTCSP